jgi:hypothetical protein
MTSRANRHLTQVRLSKQVESNHMKYPSPAIDHKQGKTNVVLKESNKIVSY